MSLYNVYFAPNGVDPSGTYEIDVHYYMTYFMGKHNPCLSDNDAKSIADADQGTDEDPDTSPALGLTADQGQINRQFHHLGNQATIDAQGNPSTYLEEQWRAAVPDSLPGRASQNCNPKNLGIYLHHLQDTFSHEGYRSPVWGHAFGFKTVDHTASNIPKARLMAHATWEALLAYSFRCNPCCYQEKIKGREEALYQEMVDQLEQFFKEPAGTFISGITPGEIAKRADLLGGIPIRPDPAPPAPTPWPGQGAPRHSDGRGNLGNDLPVNW